MKKSGVFILGLIAAAIIGWLAWTYVPWATLQIKEPAAVLITGAMAVLVAIWALFSQRAISRRQCTLEHIARIENDRALIEGRTKFRVLTKETGGLLAYAAPEKEHSAEYQTIITRLNEFELISVGIQRGIIDFELYSRWFRSGTIRAWQDSEAFIFAIRRRHNNDLIFHEFQEMVRWFGTFNRAPRRTWWLGLFR